MSHYLVIFVADNLNRESHENLHFPFLPGHGLNERVNSALCNVALWIQPR